MALLQNLQSFGVNINEALDRFMGNTELLEMMYKKMPESFAQNDNIIQYIQSGNMDEAIKRAHTLKGNMGNLSVTPLFNAYAKIVDLLRAGDSTSAVMILQKVIPVQQKLIQIILAS